MYRNLIAELQAAANPTKAEFLKRFFKTGTGQYAEGDQFLGITVPQQRFLAKKYKALTLTDIEHMLSSPFHEYRLTALFVLVLQFQKADELRQKHIVDVYLKNVKYINNWDLVDSSADKILGVYLQEKDKTLLYDFARSEDVWKRRIAMIATFADIKQHEFSVAIAIAELLLFDKHDLIQKAVGWMLREIGSRDKKTLIRFLDKHAAAMPRTMLRYSLEHFQPNERQFYMQQGK